MLPRDHPASAAHARALGIYDDAARVPESGVRVGGEVDDDVARRRFVRGREEHVAQREQRPQGRALALAHGYEHVCRRVGRDSYEILDGRRVAHPHDDVGPSTPVVPRLDDLLSDVERSEVPDLKDVLDGDSNGMGQPHAAWHEDELMEFLKVPLLYYASV